MLAKCANPDCDAPFRYLREGRLFRMDVGGGPQLVSEKKPPFHIEYFWLCSRCADRMTLRHEPGKGVIAIPLTSERRAAAS
jgi:hypothetical protein